VEGKIGKEYKKKGREGRREREREKKKRGSV